MKLHHNMLVLLTTVSLSLSSKCVVDCKLNSNNHHSSNNYHCDEQVGDPEGVSQEDYEIE